MNIVLRNRICAVVIALSFVFCCVVNGLWISSTGLTYVLFALGYPTGALLGWLWHSCPQSADP